MDDSTNPTETEVLSPDTRLGDVNEASTDIDPTLAYATDILTQEGILLAPEESAEADEEVSSEEATEDETPEVDSSDEAETDEEEDSEVTSEDEADEVDREMVDESSLDEFLFPTPEGPKTWAQITSELGQVKAASKKSREAAEELKEIEAKREELQAQEAWAKQQMEGAHSAAVLAQYDNALGALQQQIDEAAKSNDFNTVTKLKYQQDQLTTQRGEVSKQVEAVQAEQRQRNWQEQHAILEERGFSEIINDDYLAYIEPMAQVTKQHINDSAEVAIAFEKARMWDESQKKGAGGKKLKASGKTLKAGSSGSIKKAQSAKQKEAAQRIASGHASEQEVDEALLAFAQRQLSS